jgi:transposase-like protein
MTWPGPLDPAPPRCPHCHRQLVDVSLAHYEVKSYACDVCLVYLYIHPDGREEWAMQ